MGEAIPVRGPIEQEEVGRGVIPVDLKIILKEDLKIGAEVLGKNSPRQILEDAIRNSEWFKGIILSGALVEHFGAQALKVHTKGGIKLRKLNIRLWQILRLLFDYGLLPEPVYSKMNTMKEKRNDLSHEPFGEVDPEEAEGIIEILWKTYQPRNAHKT